MFLADYREKSRDREHPKTLGVVPMLSISSQCEGGSVPERPVIDALFELKEGWSD